ncbi:MAG TPA: GNAT family N-acetyltransferase [Candidatus Limnocylindrales bacterium]|nr:GNAT family N-acetyltransferase [Candidatus Limnocylindrales bacterium]
MTLSITRSDHTDPAALRAHLQVQTAAMDHDIPAFVKPTEQMNLLAHKIGWVGRRTEIYLAQLDGRPVARLDVTFPTLENLNNMFMHIEVVPEFRRRGIGRALMDKAFERARANERTTVMGNTCWTLPGLPAGDGGAGPAFAEAMGFANANLPEVMRRFELSTLDEGVLEAIFEKAKTKSSGYRLIRWIDGAPEEYIDDIAYLDGRLGQDAPMGDLAVEPEEVDAARVRAIERKVKLRGRTCYHTAAVHEESNRLVAWTTLGRDRELDWHCWQQITIVEPKHRGHRLGALVKVANLRFYLENEATTKVIDTFNAAENSYMISINEEMGFRALYSFQNWQREI